MQEQSSLGTRQINKAPTYTHSQIGRITGVADYEKYGRVEVVFLDYSQPFPVWVNGDIDRKPVEGDQVIVGFMMGRPDAPYLQGFVRNKSVTSNYITVEKDSIIVQLPADSTDSKGHMLDAAKQPNRNYIELKSNEIVIHIADGSKLTVASNNITLADGSAFVARVGDSVEVTVPSIGTCTGKITTGSSKIKA